MILNRVEKALMNNPLREASQKWYEARLLERLGGTLPGARVVEIGCGRGVGAGLILTRFKASTVLAFDLDPDMVRKAHQRLRSLKRGRAMVAVADASATPASSGAFDAVFDFGIIHHVPQWRAVLAEVHRVLKPGGRFFFEEVTRQALERWVYRTFLDHPRDDRFSGDEFLAALRGLGFRVRDVVERFFGDFIIGVADKTGQGPAGKIGERAG